MTVGKTRRVPCSGNLPNLEVEKGRDVIVGRWRQGVKSVVDASGVAQEWVVVRMAASVVASSGGGSSDRNAMRFDARWELCQ